MNHSTHAPEGSGCILWPIFNLKDLVFFRILTSDRKLKSVIFYTYNRELPEHQELNYGLYFWISWKFRSYQGSSFAASPPKFSDSNNLLLITKSSVAYHLLTTCNPKNPSVIKKPLQHTLKCFKTLLNASDRLKMLQNT